MDPLTHVVVGRALVAAASRNPTPQSLAIGAAAVLGALSPDIDSGLAFAGWDRYLRVHQAGTHSLLGALLMACCTAALIRWRSRDSRWPALLAAAGLGAVSHVALDLVSGAQIAIGWPIVSRRVSLPFVAMADPWLIGICVLGLLALWPGRVRMRTAARLVVMSVSLFLAFKAAMLAVALVRTGVVPAASTAVEARWSSLTEWTVYRQSAGTVRSVTMSSSGAPSVVVLSQRGESASPLVAASRALDTVGNFLAVHEFAFPVVAADGGDRVSVLWSDLRYCSPASAPESIRCNIWAGGIFDRSGRVLRQEVRVGRLVQTRRPPG